METPLDDTLFGRTFPCVCGKTHHIEPREVVYSDDALARLPTVCAGLVSGRRVAVLMDTRTREVAGAKSVEVLSSQGWQVTEVLVEDPVDSRWPVCDEATKEQIDSRVGEVELVLPVGSGVINDLGKWVAAERDIPFVCFATAASMNGYASANIAPKIRGAKTLVHGRPPIAVLSSPAILREAPYELTAAGLGDVLAKSISSTDWYLNHLLFGDYYCETSVNLITEIEPLYLNHPEDLYSRDPHAIRALFHALLLTGVSMTMAETSSPASGGEHLISHALDMLSSVHGLPNDLHGRQVGVGTILTADLYRRVLSVESPTFLEPEEKVDAAFWGPLSEVVAENYGRKMERLRIARERLSRDDTWDDIRRGLASMPQPPETLSNCLSRAGAAVRAEDIKCSRERLWEVFLHAHEIRSRFTILDLARLIGVMPAAADEIVQTWA